MLFRLVLCYLSLRQAADAGRSPSFPPSPGIPGLYVTLPSMREAHRLTENGYDLSTARSGPARDTELRRDTVCGHWSMGTDLLWR